MASPLWLAEGGLADQVAAAKGITREEALEAQAAKIPMGRFGTPEEMADIVVVLCSDAGLERHRRRLVGGRRGGADLHLAL